MCVAESEGQAESLSGGACGCTSAWVVHGAEIVVVVVRHHRLTITLLGAAAEPECVRRPVVVASRQVVVFEERGTQRRRPAGRNPRRRRTALVQPRRIAEAYGYGPRYIASQPPFSQHVLYVSRLHVQRAVRQRRVRLFLFVLQLSQQVAVAVAAPQLSDVGRLTTPAGSRRLLLFDCSAPARAAQRRRDFTSARTRRAATRRRSFSCAWRPRAAARMQQ